MRVPMAPAGSDDGLGSDYDMLDSDLEDEQVMNSEDEEEDTSPTSTAPSSPPLNSTSALPAAIPEVKKLPRCREKTLACTVTGCDKVFDRKARLDEHIRSHNNQRDFFCTVEGCGRTFLRDSHRKRHVKSAHSDVRDHVCTWENCDQAFSTGTRLRRHLDTHKAKEQFTCRGYDGCAQTFRKQETLDRHILSVHQDIKPFPCTFTDPVTGHPCKKAYDTAERLRGHISSKHDTTRFGCNECSQRNASILRNSEGQDDREVVDANFATYNDLRAHNAIYHPPTCEFCPTSFVTNKELTRHLELQHGILPANAAPRGEEQAIPCTHPGCGKVFSKRGNLNVHVKTVHENVRNFVCGKSHVNIPEAPTAVVNGCNRSFTSRGSLEEHVRTAHLDLPSKRSRRHEGYKRKASAAGTPSDDEDEDFIIKKPRNQRSDKGKIRGTALTSLADVGMFIDPPITCARPDPEAPILPTGYAYAEPAGALPASWLTAETTMYGNQIFQDGMAYPLHDSFARASMQDDDEVDENAALWRDIDQVLEQAEREQSGARGGSYPAL